MEVGAQAGTMMVSALRRAPIPSVGTCRPCTMRRSPLSPATIRSWYQGPTRSGRWVPNTSQAVANSKIGSNG